eukprot:5387971-Prymnesium_polylepis.2
MGRRLWHGGGARSRVGGCGREGGASSQGRRRLRHGERGSAVAAWVRAGQRCDWVRAGQRCGGSVGGLRWQRWRVAASEAPA